MKTTGTRAQVMHGTASKTTGGLTKKDLVYNKGGDIVSKKKSVMAKRSENDMLKLWRRAVKIVSASKAYENKFLDVKAGSSAYNKVFAEYEKLVVRAYAKTHNVKKEKNGKKWKLVLSKKKSKK